MAAISTFVVGLSASHVGMAASVPTEKSKYGAFELRNVGDDCEIWFKRAGGTRAKLFGAEYCSDEKLATFSATEKAGGLAFPAISKAGEEFHLFEIPTARGGNATTACDYFVVIVDAKRAWASDLLALGECDGASLRDAKLSDSPDGSTLRLTLPPTYQSDGMAFDVRLGSIKKSVLPRPKPSSTGPITLTGELQGPYHVTMWRYAISTGKDDVLIDVPGKCDLDALVGERVSFSGIEEKWSTGERRITCVTVKKQKK